MKKDKKNQIFRGMIIVLLLCIVSGCQNKDEKKEGEHFTIMTILHTSEIPSDRIATLLAEKTNTDLQIQWVPNGNYIETLYAAFATDSLPEATFLGNITTYLYFKEAMKDGQFWEIGPLLDEFPNLNNLNQSTYENLSVDGKIYALYQGRRQARSGLIYRKDWADRLGLSAPTTIDEFYEMARAFTEDDPDGNGMNDTFGLVDRNDLIYGAFKTVASWFGTPNGWGEKDGQIIPDFMFPEYIETMKFFKKMRDDGYMNRDFPLTSKEDQQSLVEGGEAGMYIGSLGDVLPIYNSAIKENPKAEFDVQNTIIGPTGSYQIWSLPGYHSVVLFPKSAVKTEERLKEILSFFDQLASPELANLLFWGIENEHYTVKDGFASVSAPAEIIEKEVKPYQSLEIGEPETNGRYEHIPNVDIREKAERLMKENEQYIVEDVSVQLISPTHIAVGDHLEQIIHDATYEYILGIIDEKEFKNTIQEWKKYGGDQVIEEYTHSYNEKKGNF